MKLAMTLTLLAFALASCLGESPSPTTAPTTTTTTTTTSVAAPTTTTPPPTTPTAAPTTSPTTSAPTTTPSPTTTYAAPQHVHVGYNGNTFDPETLQVALNGVVQWHHHSGSHTVTIHKEGTPNGQYVQDSSLASGEVSYTFTQSGTYHVFCKPHSSGEEGVYTPLPGNMASTITVG